MAEGTQTEKVDNQGGGDRGDQAADATKKEDSKTASPWYEGYPEDIREDLKGYDKPETLAKEFVSLKKKYVVPDKPEDYEFGDKEFNEKNQANIAAWKAKAKEFGLTKEQFAKLTEFEVANTQELRKRVALAEEEEIKKSVKELQGEWGNKFDDNVKAAKKTMQSIFPQSFGNFLETSKLGNHPELIKAMFRLSEAVSEDVLFKAQTKNKASNRDPQTGEPMLKFSSMK